MSLVGIFDLLCASAGILPRAENRRTQTIKTMTRATLATPKNAYSFLKKPHKQHSSITINESHYKKNKQNASI